MVKLAAVCAAVLSCLAFSPASASVTPSPPSPAPNPPSVTIRVLSSNGSGCPPGTAVAGRGSSQGLTVTYSRFIAAAGDSAGLGDFRRNCQGDVSVVVPAGWTYGLSEVDYQGFAYLGTGARGTLETDYYFSGQAATSQLQHQLSGPRNGDYRLVDRPRAVVWAPCRFNGTLNVNTSARVFAGSDKSFLDGLAMVDSLSTTYHLAFMRC